MRPVGHIRAPFVAALLAGLMALGLASCGRQPPPPSPTPNLSPDLREAVTVDGILSHAERFQAIADEHGGNRAAGTPGYDASADYVAERLRRAGYEVEVQYL